MSVELKKDIPPAGDREDITLPEDRSTVDTGDYTTILDDLQEEITGKIQRKKEKTLILADVYERLEEYRRAGLVEDCGTYLEYKITPTEKRLQRANFCRDRLCPMCNWRRSLKIFGQVSRVMDVLEQRNYQFLFLTLTVQNVPMDELSAGVDDLLAGWRYLYNKNSVFRRAIAGTYRSLEVTYSQEHHNWHHHLHVVLVVKSDYFVRHYVSQKEWRQLWAKACALTYDPSVDIRKIRPKKIGGLASAVAEIARYTVKDNDYLSGSEVLQQSKVRGLLDGLVARRLYGMTGVFREVAQQLRLDDAVDGDLVNVDADDTIRDDVASAIVYYHWRHGVYVLGLPWDDQEI